MKMIRMTSVVFLAFLYMYLFARSVDVNFSGVWKLNESKSDFGDSQWRRAPHKMTITQEGNNLTIERVSKRRSGEEMTTTDKLTMDGKECINKGFRDQEKKSVVTWTEDGKGLIITSSMSFEREGQSFNMTTREELQLSADGNALTVDTSSKSPRGDRKTKAVYDKEKASE